MPRPKTFQLERAFGAAYKSVKAKQDSLNALDRVNGDHGSHAVKNFKIMSQAMKAAKGQQPSAQLAAAAAELEAKGQGGTARHYVNGLRAAAQQFEGQERLGKNDVPALLQSLMGNVPAQGYQPTAAAQSPQANQNDISDLLSALGGQGNVAPAAGASGAAAPAQAGAGSNVLSALLGLAAGGGASPAPAAPPAADPLSALLGGAGGAAQDPFSALLGAAGGQSSGAQDPLAALLGGASGGQSSGAQDPFAALLGAAGGGASQQPSAPTNPLGALLGSLIPDKPGLDLADVIQAGTAYMGAQAQGADAPAAALQAVMAAIRGVDPLATGSPRAASGGLLAQSILDDAFGKKK